MENRNKEARRYCRAIKRLLPCGSRQRKAIVRNLEASVEAYLEQNPNATFEQLEAALGKSSDVAESYVAAMGLSEIREKLHTKRKILFAVTAVLLVILISWGAVVGIEVSSSHHDINGAAPVESVETVYKITE